MPYVIKKFRRRRTAVRRKRSLRKRKSWRPGPSIPRPMTNMIGGFPKSCRVKLKWSRNIQMAPAGALYVENIFRANGPYDPDTIVAVGQISADNWASFANVYRSYYVLASTITMKPILEAGGIPVQYGIYNSKSVTPTFTSVNELYNYGGTWMTPIKTAGSIAAQDNNLTTQVARLKFNTNMFGVTNPNDQSGLRGLTIPDAGTAQGIPAIPWYFHAYVGSHTTTPGNRYFNFQITYDMVFTEMRVTTPDDAVEFDSNGVPSYTVQYFGNNSV